MTPELAKRFQEGWRSPESPRRAQEGRRSHKLLGFCFFGDHRGGRGMPSISLTATALAIGPSLAAFFDE